MSKCNTCLGCGRFELDEFDGDEDCNIYINDGRGNKHESNDQFTYEK